MKNCWTFLVLCIFSYSLLVYVKSFPRSRARRNAYKNSSRLWPKGIVPYTMDEAYTLRERKIIERAMRDIHVSSCIRFKKHSSEKAYVEIVKDKGCRAVVGYIGRRQRLTLGQGCIFVSQVLHELFHVLGFFHEHTRPDRDQYVVVQEGNIKPASINNFRKMNPSKVTTFGLPYDYYSVLHYHDREFAIDRSQRTLVPTGSRLPDIGKAATMSRLDVLKLNKLYRCSKSKYRAYDEEEDGGSGLTELEHNFIIV